MVPRGDVSASHFQPLWLSQPGQRWITGYDLSMIMYSAMGGGADVTEYGPHPYSNPGHAHPMRWVCFKRALH